MLLSFNRNVIKNWIQFSVIIGMIVSCHSKDESNSIPSLQVVEKNQSSIQETKEITPQEVWDVSKFKNSSAVMIPNKFLELREDGMTAIKNDGVTKLSQHPDLGGIPLCEENHFGNLPYIANCTGFLIAPNILVTAGQCYLSDNSCSDFNWVFDYDPKGLISSKNIYSCKKVLHQSVSIEISDSSDQFAIIELDREVEDRSFIPLGKIQTPMDGDEVLAVGNFFSVTPQTSKISKSLIELGKGHFSSDLDKWNFSPGALVIDSKEGNLLGLLVRSEGGFKFNKEIMCMDFKTCDYEWDCPGSVITSLSGIEPSALLKVKKNLAVNFIQKNDINSLSTLIKDGFNIDTKDEYGRTLFLLSLSVSNESMIDFMLGQRIDLMAIDYNGQGALHYAVRGKSQQAIDLLLNFGFDPNAKDKLGQTPYSISLKLGLNEISKTLALNGGKQIENNENQLGFLQYCNDPFASDSIKETVSFLKERVRKESCKEANDALIGLSNMFIANDNEFDLRPLVSLVNLNRLEIIGTKTKSLEFLKELPNLKHLRISSDSFKDFSVIGQLSQLEVLKIQSSELKDLSILENLKNLKTLELQSENLDELKNISGLSQLETLILTGSNIKGFEEISKMTWLKELQVKDATIGELGILKSLTNLIKVVLNRTSVEDISTFGDLVNLERLYIDQNQITDLSPLLSLSKLKTLNVNDNPIVKDEEHCPTEKAKSKALSRFCKAYLK